ncbi:MAG: hypothetical protein R2865_01265 [Deinococcales bacterium]
MSLPEVKEALPELKQIHSQVLQDTLKRLDKAYQAFFARLKRGDKAGFPRFQGRNRFDSITSILNTKPSQQLEACTYPR